MKRGSISLGSAPGGKGDEHRKLDLGTDAPGQFAIHDPGWSFCPDSQGQSTEN